MPSSLSTRKKINPFELDLEGEDGDGDDWDDEGSDQYAAENQRLMDDNNNYTTNAATTSSSTSSAYDDDDHHYHHHTNRRAVSYSGHTHERSNRTFRSYHNEAESWEGNGIHHHTPQFWKYVLLATLLGFAIVFWYHQQNNTYDGTNEEYKNHKSISMIDEMSDDRRYRLVILGERHSGISWLQARLQECFPRVSVSTHLQRPGFFFQDLSKGGWDDVQQPNVIVIHLTLNIYHWLELMRSSPEYAPNHVIFHEEGHMVPLSWEEFLRRPWTMDRPARDFLSQNSTNMTTMDELVCQLGFEFSQVISCVEKPLGGTDNPIYELKDDGTPFESIIAMRAAKLKNHQNVQTWDSVKKFITVSYENAGKEFQSRLLEEIHNFANWTPACSGHVLPPLRDQSSSMSDEYVDYVTQNTDWDAEALVSYTPWMDYGESTDEAFENQQSATEAAQDISTNMAADNNGASDINQTEYAEPTSDPTTNPTEQEDQST